MTKAPKTIWLQRDEDDTRHPCETEGVTWCENKINDTDTEYVRADQLAAERAVSDRLLEALKMVSLTRRIEGIEHAIKLIAEVEAMRKGKPE